MRQAGLRDLSKSDLLKVAALSIQERHTAQVVHGRLLRRWWPTLAAVAGAAFTAGLLFGWLVAL